VSKILQYFTHIRDKYKQKLQLILEAYGGHLCTNDLAAENSA